PPAQRAHRARRVQLPRTPLPGAQLIALEQAELHHRLSGLVVDQEALAVTQRLSGIGQAEQAGVEAPADRQASGKRQHVPSPELGMVDTAEVDGRAASGSRLLHRSIVLLE